MNVVSVKNAGNTLDLETVESSLFSYGFIIYECEGSDRTYKRPHNVYETAYITLVYTWDEAHSVMVFKYAGFGFDELENSDDGSSGSDSDLEFDAPNPEDDENMDD